MPRKGETTETEVAEQPTTPTSPTSNAPLGEGQTRTGAKALTVEAANGTKRTFTAGGDKGQAVQALLEAEDNGLTRKEIAEKVGCSPSRVAEVARVLGISGKPKTIAVVTEETATAVG